MGNLIFNGVSTVDMGVQIQTPPVYEFPDKVYDTIRVEGRSGDLVIYKNSYQNVKRKYYLALGFRKGSTFVVNAKTLVEWLLSTDGYARLEDSYEPDYYRMALFEDPGEMVNYYDDATTLEVSFNCKPQRYLKNGDIPKIITQTNTLVKIINPTKCIALPEIKLNGDNVELSFYKGETPVRTSLLKTKPALVTEFIVDSEIQDCHTINEYVNNKVIIDGEFPKLYPGVNWVNVAVTGNLRKLEIKPRWWTL